MDANAFGEERREAKRQKDDGDIVAVELVAAVKRPMSQFKSKRIE
jgi:hypothetical protein